MELKDRESKLAAINAELKFNEERFRCLSACDPIGIFLTDRNGKCTYTNSNCQSILDFKIEQNWQEKLAELIHPEDRDRILQDLSDPDRISEAVFHEFRIYSSPDLVLEWIHLRISPILSPTNKFLGHVGTVETITSRKQAEEKIEQLNNLLEKKVEQRTRQLNLSNQKLTEEIKLKEVLLQEVHHRVKNNLQIISSILNIQSRSLSDPTTVSIFKESQNRVKTMALVHEKLYQSTDLSQIDFSEYIKELT
ncbi:MAG: sensor histidine kinase [Prochloraceae cyanobacterium]